MGVLGIYKNNPTAGETDGTKVVAGNPIITPFLDMASNAATEIKLAQAFVALLKPVVDHLQAIAAQTPAADIGVVEGEVDPTLVTEASMRG